MPVSSKHTGWRRDVSNSRLDMYYNGTRVGAISAAGISTVAAVTATTSVDATTSVSAGTTVAATTTVTGGTGVIATTGNITCTAGDVRITAGNERLGVVSTFGTTEPTSAVVFKTGTAPAGAITTSGGVFTDGTTVKKIIAAGTVSDVQT
jgi:hypothetical protein